MKSKTKSVIAWIVAGIAIIIFLSIAQQRAFGQGTNLPPAISNSSTNPPPDIIMVHNQSEAVLAFLHYSGFSATGAGVIMLALGYICHFLRNTALKNATHSNSGLISKIIAMIGGKPITAVPVAPSQPPPKPVE
jgi:hypothetical protein